MLIQKREVVTTSIKMACVALVLPLTLSGCSDDEAESGGGGGSESRSREIAWEGETPHLFMEGSVGGEDFSVAAEGAEAADVGTLFCERNYIVPVIEDESTWGEGYLEKVEFKFNFIFQEQFAEFQVELVADDLNNLVGKSIALGDASELAVKITVDEDGPNEAEFEGEAVSGTAKLMALSGELGADGLIIPDSEGIFGLTVDAVLSGGGQIQGTATMNCADNDLEIPEE